LLIGHLSGAIALHRAQRYPFEIARDAPSGVVALFQKLSERIAFALPLSGASWRVRFSSFSILSA
jgi:hypothetical protein